MKAISPMIATVLLIAFTVAVGGILSIWLSSLTATQTGVVGTAGEKAAKCAASSIVVKEVRYPSTGSTNQVNVTVIYQTGTENLSNITVEVTARGNTTSNSSATTVVPGETRALYVLNASTPPEIVRARGFCQDTYPVSGQCKSGEDCMKSV